MLNELNKINEPKDLKVLSEEELNKLAEKIREILLKKQEEIKNTVERLDYKIELYNEIEAGKRKDFMEQP